MINRILFINALKSVIYRVKSVVSSSLCKLGQQELVLLGTTVLSVVVVMWIVEPGNYAKTAKPYRPGEHGIPEFDKFAAGTERKKAFFDYFSPLIEEENSRIRGTRQKLLKWNQNRESIQNNTKNQIQKIAANYRLNEFDIDNDAHWDSLLRRVDTIPPSLALAQAANESAWGTSRFSRIANNYYGQWCFKAGCGVVPDRRDANKNHEVAAFNSPKESVERYIHNLNTHNAYKGLRKIRSRLNSERQPITGLELAAGLSRYSERGEEYINELRAMISFNKLTRYDTDWQTKKVY